MYMLSVSGLTMKMSPSMQAMRLRLYALNLGQAMGGFRGTTVTLRLAIASSYIRHLIVEHRSI